MPGELRREELEGAVRAALTEACSLDPFHLRVAVEGGVAYIDGIAASFRDKQMASALAAQVAGVREVVNRLRVAPARPRPDAALWGELQAALAQDPHLRDAPIAIHIKDGVVRLTGRVSDFEARTRAERLAWAVPGVKVVINQLEVDALPEGLDLRRDLLLTMEGCLGLSPSSINIDLQGRAIILRGTVPSPYHRLAAEEMARWHGQGRDVLNYLLVAEEGPQSGRLTA